ncbi:nucleotidyltransferase family protein [Piscinibacter koreensis]|uniref:Nucleotidyltransferase family protein n=1 Tax=Piscinibacter koreensis TaxID=2742824 RepID=A0A7Y6NL79_9BURK|nr:nucleotidyltransferase family protein [Schlegelella koreensis]NUZ05251.1 nucleotidyltransferase family protein [Schlegelella koreensis]
MTDSVAVVVLAAGLGSRFGGPLHKLAQPLGDSTVLSRTLETSIATGLPVVVVTTQGLSELARRSVAARDVVVVPPVGSAGGLGMGYSISAGVTARPDAAGWIVLPGDMPLVRPSTLLRVAAALTDHLVVYAQHQGRRGHPVGFSLGLYSDLVALSGDEGARRLLARYPALGLEVDDAGVLIDIDTPDDLAAVRHRAPAGEQRAPSNVGV